MKNVIFYSLGLLLLFTSCTEKTKAVNLHVRSERAYEKGDTEKALELNSKALELYPEFEDSHLLKIKIVEYYPELGDIIPAYTDLINLKIKKGDTLALGYDSYPYNNFNSYNNSLDKLYVKRGRAKGEKGLSKEAILDFENALKIDSTNIDVVSEMGFLSFSEKDYIATLKYLKTLEEDGYNYYDYNEQYNALAYSYYKLDSLDRACRLWYEIVEYDYYSEREFEGQVLKTPDEYYSEICTGFYNLDE